ncbi:MAG: hypothetical protein LBI49_13095 [Nocardiopsaceae bacterium]|nr:hypothetical protein [Nocardiopsaceae bacterium]
MSPVWGGLLPAQRGFTDVVRAIPSAPVMRKERFMSDLIYIALTIVVFAALWLLVKGVERVER